MKEQRARESKQRNIESGEGGADPVQLAEKQGWHAKDLCAGEVGGEGAVSTREVAFCSTLAR